MVVWANSLASSTTRLTDCASSSVLGRTSLRRYDARYRKRRFATPFQRWATSIPNSPQLREVNAALVIDRRRARVRAVARQEDAQFGQ
jgi:hypothetical protein